jgi:integrase/recombinase XerD
MPTDLTDTDRPISGQSLTTLNDSATEIDGQLEEACRAWLLKSPSPDTRSNYKRDLDQFLAFCGFASADRHKLPLIRPEHVAAWRDTLAQQQLTNSSIRRKLTVLRSLFSYLQTYGYVGANPAHSDFVDAPAAPRDGKTLGLTPEDCRRLLEAPSATTPAGIRDRAILGILAYTGCRVGELTRIKVGSYKTSGVHRILEIRGKGGKERNVPVAIEAVERLEAWLDAASIRDESNGPMFRAAKSARANGRDGFVVRPLSRRAVQGLVKEYVRRLKLDPHVTVHSLRVTALTNAREQGSDIIDLQDFAGHADPRTTLTYIRNRDRLSKSPAYVLKY